MTDQYERAFTPGRVIDGDTITADHVDLGYHVEFGPIQYRVLRINCPERHQPTLAEGNAAKAYTEDWLLIHARHGGPLFATTQKTDNFGRYLAEITCTAGHNLADDLLTAGHAVPYKAK